MKLFVFAALLSIVKCSPTNLASGRDCSKKEEWMNQCEEFPSNLVAINHNLTNVECELGCVVDHKIFDFQRPYFGGKCAVLTKFEKDKCLITWDPPPRWWTHAIEIVSALKAMGDDDVDDVFNALELEDFYPRDIFKLLFKPSKGIMVCQAWSQLKRDGKFVIGGDSDLTVLFKDGKCSFFPLALPLNEVANLGATPSITKNIATSRYCGVECTPPRRDCSKKEEWMNQCEEFPSYLVARSHDLNNVRCALGCQIGCHFGGSGNCTVLTKNEKDKCFIPWDPPTRSNAIQIISGLKAMGDDDVDDVINALELREYFSEEIFRILFKPSKGIMVCQAWSQLKKHGNFVIGGDYGDELLVLSKDGKCSFIPALPFVPDVPDEVVNLAATANINNDTKSMGSMRFCQHFDCPMSANRGLSGMLIGTDVEVSSDSSIDVIQNSVQMGARVASTDGGYGGESTTGLRSNLKRSRTLK